MKASVQDDLLSRALYRAKAKRPAIFGVAEIAADDIVGGYLQAQSVSDGLGEVERIDKLEDTLTNLAAESPEAMQFLRYILHRATGFTPAVKAAAEPETLPTQGREQDKEDEDDLTITSDSDVNRIVDSPLYNACITAINNRMRGACYYHYNSYWTIGEDIGNMIAAGASRAEVRQFLSTGAYGRFTPAPNQATEVDEFVDEIFDGIIPKVKRDSKTKWKVIGKEDTSYFEEVLSARKNMSPQYWYSNPGHKEKTTKYCCPRKSDQPSIDYPTRTDDKPFRFMDLPPELRNNVFRLLLAPGDVFLRSCMHHNPQGTFPKLVPSILATSKQVLEEASNLFFENTFMVTLGIDYNGACRPALHRAQLPLRVLPKITNLVILIDCIRFKKINCEFTSLQALTGLKTLRIVAVEEPKFAISFPNFAFILAEILVRVPADAEVNFGCSSGAQKEGQKSFVRWMQDELTSKCGLKRDDGAIEKVEELDVGVLEEAADAMGEDVVQGSRSGEVPKGRGLPGDWEGLRMTMR